MTSRTSDRLRFLISALLCIPVMLGAFRLSDQYQYSHCPSGTFLTGSVEPTMQMLSLIGLFMILSFYIARLFKRVGWFGDQSSKEIVPDYAYGIAIFGLTILWMMGTASHFCATGNGIIYDDTAHGITKNFGWRDVGAINTSCYYQNGKGAGWRETFVATMRDGTSIDLIGRNGLPEIYPRIVAALNGHDFAFSANIQPNCGYSHLNLLTHRP